MNAEITFSQLWWNASLMNFFFRNQAEDTLNELVESVEESTSDVIDRIDDYYDDLDECEEDFYSGTIPELIEQLGLTPIEKDDDEEDED